MTYLWKWPIGGDWCSGIIGLTHSF